MADKKTTDIDGSQVGVAGDGTKVKNGIHIKKGDEIDADGRDIAFSKGKGRSTIIKIGKIFQQKPLVTSATAFLIIILLVVFGFVAWLCLAPPRFEIVNSILRSDSPIIIKAANWQADKNKSLNVEFDGFLFCQKGMPLSGNNDQALQEWQFILTDHEYTQDMLREDSHRIRVGFPGGRLSCSDDSCMIAFINSPPTVMVENKAGREAHTRTLKGKATSPVQIPGNTISVVIFYYHDGPTQEISVPVQVKEDAETGITYFEFETCIQGLPHISPDNPAFSEPFFGFKLTDMAGNSYFQEQSYAKYMAPGSNRFGFESLAVIKVEKREDDGEFRNIIRLTPTQIPIQNQLPDGQPAIVLNVTGKTLKWRSNVKNRLPVTVIFQDEKQIGTSLSNEYKVGEQPVDVSVAYRVEQEDEKGIRYTSEIKRVITNSIGAKFVYIHPGTFMMGSSESEPEHYSDEKQHKVILTQGFYMQTTELTQGQWQQIMGENPSYFKICGPDCPVERVSWNDVQIFIGKLNQRDPSMKYRLPTEAEWEYTCRAGTTTPFAFGRCLSANQAYYNGNYPLEKCKKGVYREKTVSVASLEPNAWGLFDMHGNVWEWCWDWYGRYPVGSVTNPAGPDTGSDRVIRGGSWINGARRCRSANRLRNSPASRDDNLGFRLVLLLSQQGK